MIDTTVRENKVDTYKEEWRQSPYTEHLKAEVKRDLGIALQTLLKKCAASSDPEVLRVYGQWQAADAKLQMLENGTK